MNLDIAQAACLRYVARCRPTARQVGTHLAKHGKIRVDHRVSRAAMLVIGPLEAAGLLERMRLHAGAFAPAQYRLTAAGEAWVAANPEAARG